MSIPPSSLKRESITVALLTLLGAVLRFWNESRLGLNHFDEGIYALAGLWISSPKGLAGISPELIAYAPPGFPALVGVSYLFLGVSDVAAILVSQVAGVITIPVVAWLGRRTFGPGAGAAGAALAAISGGHVVFSRMALTDVSFLLTWLVALGMGMRFLERPNVVRAVVFGFAVGLSQNFKYNGWLSGVIVAATALLSVLGPCPDRVSRLLRTLGFGLIAVLVAALVYWPWYRFVDARTGGYAALMAHHRGYLSGPAAWPDHFWTQMRQVTALSGLLVPGLGWGAVAWTAAWLGGWFAAGWPGKVASPTRWTSARFRLGLLLGLIVLGCSPNAPFWISLACLPWLLSDRREAVRLVGVAWLTMAILTPFYHPYARLWLSLQAVGWLVVAGLIVELGPSPTAWVAGKVEEQDRRIIALRRLLATGAVLGSLLLELGSVPQARPLSWPTEPTDGLRTFILQVSASIERAGPKRIQAVTRPTVLFYLQSQSPISIVRQPSIAACARDFQPGDYLLNDSLVEGWTGLDGAFTSDRFNATRMLNGALYFTIPTPPATLLDSTPGLATEPPPRRGHSSSLGLIPIMPR